MELGVEVVDLLKTIFIYGLISTFILVQPAEFRMAGFTMDSIFYKLLGNKDSDYLAYQLRRITLTQMMHLSFMISFFFMLACFSNEPIWVLWPTNAIQILCSFVLLIAILAVTLVIYLTSNDFDNHYVVKKLQKQYEGRSWRQLSADVTRELSDPFAVRAVDSSESGIYVSDSWLLRITLYNIELIKLEDAKFTVIETIEHPLSLQNEDCQIVLIKIESISSAIKSFLLHLQSRNIMQLIRDKIGDNFHVAPGVTLSVSTVDRFVQVFRSIVSQHETYIYRHSEELENCFGCMAVQPNVKLQRMCSSYNCKQCNCRPAWCHACLARVFVSEQLLEAPYNWLQGTARCPTCRARFCVMDVLPIKIETNN